MNTQRVAAMLVVSTFFGCFTTTESLVTDGGSDAGHQTRLKPNVMLLVDNSGSMTDPITGGGTRIDALKSALSSVLTSAGSSARFGLAVFPENGQGTQSIRVELPAAATTDDSAVLQAKATEVNEALQQLQPSGGTPTAASLAFVGTDTGLNAADSRADFIVLITDGTPNSNAANPNAICDCGTTCDSTRQAACACTQGACDSPGLCSVGCLDEDATIASLNSLSVNRHITTFVVSYGSLVTTGNGKTVMNSMAAAGNSGSVSYDANTQAELNAALIDIIGRAADAGM